MITVRQTDIYLGLEMSYDMVRAMGMCKSHVQRMFMDDQNQLITRKFNKTNLMLAADMGVDVQFFMDKIHIYADTCDWVHSVEFLDEVYALRHKYEDKVLGYSFLPLDCTIVAAWELDEDDELRINWIKFQRACVRLYWPFLRKYCAKV